MARPPPLFPPSSPAFPPRPPAASRGCSGYRRAWRVSTLESMPPGSEPIPGRRADPEDGRVGYQPVVEVLRGGIVESVHYGAGAVADPLGNLVAWGGDSRAVIVPRPAPR